MKVIGKIDSDVYICQVSHGEIEKFLNLYYGNLKHLSVGQEIDLGKGHDYHCQIRDAMRATRELVEKHQPVITAILNGLRIESKCSEQQP